MAQNLVGNTQNITDPKRANGASAAIELGSVTTPATYDSQKSLDDALKVANAAYFTQKVLDNMNFNDKVYAARVYNDANTIK